MTKYKLYVSQVKFEAQFVNYIWKFTSFSLITYPFPSFLLLRLDTSTFQLVRCKYSYEMTLLTDEFQRFSQILIFLYGWIVIPIIVLNKVISKQQLFRNK